MSSDANAETANKLVEYCRQNNATACLDELYAQDAVSVEALDTDGEGSAVTKGLDGIRGKHEWWDNTFQVHSANVDGPYMHGDSAFSVIFDMDVEHKESGERSQMKEVAVYHTNADGMVHREEFFYTV